MSAPGTRPRPEGRRAGGRGPQRATKSGTPRRMPVGGWMCVLIVAGRQRRRLGRAPPVRTFARDAHRLHTHRAHLELRDPGIGVELARVREEVRGCLTIVHRDEYLPS